jgi:hypothetical protein
MLPGCLSARRTMIPCVATAEDVIEETIRYFRCVECGADNIDASDCHACGHPSPSNQADNEDALSISLTFAQPSRAGQRRARRDRPVARCDRPAWSPSLSRCLDSPKLSSIRF